MEIILLEKVRNLGSFGETVKVANGYARNFLIPYRKAVPVTAEAKLLVEERRQQLAQKESNLLEVAQARADLMKREVTLSRLVGEGDNLYGSVSPADIAEALNAIGCDIAKSEVILAEGPIKQLGEFIALATLHAEIQFPITVSVIEEVDNTLAPSAKDMLADTATEKDEASVEDSAAKDMLADTATKKDESSVEDSVKDSVEDANKAST